MTLSFLRPPPAPLRSFDSSSVGVAGLAPTSGAGPLRPSGDAGPGRPAGRGGSTFLRSVRPRTGVGRRVVSIGAGVGDTAGGFAPSGGFTFVDGGAGGLAAWADAGGGAGGGGGGGGG